MNRKDKLFEIEKLLEIPKGLRITYKVWKEGYNQFIINIEQNEITFDHIIIKKKRFSRKSDITFKNYTIETLPTEWVLYIFDKGHMRDLIIKKIFALMLYEEREKLWSIFYEKN